MVVGSTLLQDEQPSTKQDIPTVLEEVPEEALRLFQQGWVKCMQLLL